MQPSAPPTRSRARRVLQVLHDAVLGFMRDDCPMIAASLAFYSVFSFAPLVVIVLNLSAWVVDADVGAAYLETQAGSWIGSAGASQVRQVLEDAAGAGQQSSILSGAAAIVGAMTILVQLQHGLNRVWRAEPSRGDVVEFALKRLTSIALIAIFAVVLVASVFVSSATAAATTWLEGRIPETLGRTGTALGDLGASLAVFTVLFTSLFKFLPDVRLAWRDVAFGGLLTGSLFVLGKALLAQILGLNAVGTLYGAASSFAIVLVWIYYTALLFLFGAEITRAWSTRFPSTSAAGRPSRRDRSPLPPGHAEGGSLASTAEGSPGAPSEDDPQRP